MVFDKFSINMQLCSYLIKNEIFFIDKETTCDCVRYDWVTFFFQTFYWVTWLISLCVRKWGMGPRNPVVKLLATHIGTNQLHTRVYGLNTSLRLSYCSCFVYLALYFHLDIEFLYFIYIYIVYFENRFTKLLDTGMHYLEYNL